MTSDQSLKAEGNGERYPEESGAAAPPEFRRWSAPQILEVTRGGTEATYLYHCGDLSVPGPS